MPLTTTLGARASAAWIQARGLDISRTPGWYLEITIPTSRPDTRCELDIYPEEWGVVFRRGARVSTVRVTDVAFVHGLDEDGLLPEFPPLDRVNDLFALLERRHELTFDRAHATVHTNLARATQIVRAWLAQT